MRHLLAALLLAAPAAVVAQKPLPANQQIALAVLPLPKAMRAGASVLGYDASGKLVALRKGTNAMICLGTDPKDIKQFHVACYHNSMDPYMARGRDLRLHGANQNVVDSVRAAEAKSGKIVMPKQGAALWMLTGPWTGVDVAKATVTSAVMPMYEVYVPWATSASLGVPDEPVPYGPWIMEPGSAKAHLMFTPSMN
jgi:hypothetical protein